MTSRVAAWFAYPRFITAIPPEYLVSAEYWVFACRYVIWSCFLEMFMEGYWNGFPQNRRVFENPRLPGYPGTPWLENWTLLSTTRVPGGYTRSGRSRQRRMLSLFCVVMRFANVFCRCLWRGNGPGFHKTGENRISAGTRLYPGTAWLYFLCINRLYPSTAVVPPVVEVLV